MGKKPTVYCIIAMCFLSLVVSPCFSLSPKAIKQARIYRDKGYQAQCRGDLDEALSYYQKAIEANPDYAEAYNDVGVMFETRSKYDRAKQAYLKAIASDDHFVRAYYNLASLYEKEANYDKAAYYWRLRVQMGDPADPWTKRAKQRLDNLEQEGVVSSIDATMPLTRSSTYFDSSSKIESQFHLDRGRMFLAKRNYPEALKELTRALMLDEGNREIEQLIENTQDRMLSK